MTRTRISRLRRNKAGHEKDKVKNIFHIKEPALLTGEEFNILVADTMHVVNAVKKRFNGSVFLLGPMPRHLSDCCTEPAHKIKDHIGVEVDMIKYVNTFSDQLKRELKLPADTYFLDYRQIFGDTFSSKSLSDGVHLDKAESNKLAHALLKGHDVLLPAPTVAGDPDQTFADALLAQEIVTPEMKSDKLGEEELNYDDLDYEG